MTFRENVIFEGNSLDYTGSFDTGLGLFWEAEIKSDRQTHIQISIVIYTDNFNSLFEIFRTDFRPTVVLNLMPRTL
jgi:hypothetical protein